MLVVKLKSKSGRNNTGRITVRHQGGGVKRLYRLIDFKRTKYDIPATVTAIEYDPNREPRLALVEYKTNETNGTNRAYILAPEGLKVGDQVMSSQNKVEAAIGARMPLKHIPVGLFVHDIELTPGKGGQLVRGAGSGAQLQVFEGEYAQLRLPSGEQPGSSIWIVWRRLEKLAIPITNWYDMAKLAECVTAAFVLASKART